MKTVLAALFFTFFCINGQAQIKILFDATKAETANNADWVIDADQFDLGYNTTAYIGGNEANAQQEPTPSQAAITATTTQDYWTGALSAWAVDAVQLGYSVETLPYNGSITYNDAGNAQDLSNYDVFIVCEPNILFTATEKTALLHFVQNGGGLFMIADHHNSDRNGDGYDSPDIWNDLMTDNTVQNNPFGMTFDYEFFTEATENIPTLSDDPLLQGSYGDVTRVEFYGGTSLTLDSNQNNTVTGVVYRESFSNSGSTGVLCAYASYGNGRVVALGDSSPADDGTGDPGDSLYDGWIEDANGNHERLLMNATIWLAQEESVAVADYIRENNVVHLVTYQGNTRFYVEDNSSIHRYTLQFYNSLGQLIWEKNQLLAHTDYQINLPPVKGILYYRVSRIGQVVQYGKLLMN